MRGVKSDAEIAYIRKAAAISEAAADAGVSAVRDGATENDVASAIISTLIAEGGEFVATWPNVKAGWRTGLAHAAWAGERLEKGSWATMEFAGVVRRYHAPVYRTVFVGDPPANVRKVAETIRVAHDAGIAALQPGRMVGEIDKAQRAVVEEAGLGHLMGHRTGYAVGIGFPPTWAQTFGVSIVEGSQVVLRPGMVFHMVMYMFEPAQYGVGLGQTVLLTDSGSEILTPRTDKGPIFLS